mgnify:CR=1 FL=1
MILFVQHVRAEAGDSARSFGSWIDNFNEIHAAEMGWLYEHNLPEDITLEEHYGLIHEDLQRSRNADK